MNHLQSIKVQTETENGTSNTKQAKKNQLSYIAEAALEYFIDIMIKGAFLAAILLNIGVSQAVAGVISTLYSLGFTAQLFAVLFIRPKNSVKKMVTVMHFVNQLMFVSLYMIPYFSVPQSVKVTAFIIMYLGGCILSHFAMPFKLNWLMSYVPDNQRGRFTANKEIVSLLSGMIFSYVMGALIDHFEAIGKAETGFVLSGITVFVLCILHLISLLAVKDTKSAENKATSHHSHTVKSVLQITLFDSKMSKIILLDIIWHIATGVSVSFFSTYTQTDLGLSLSVIAIIHAVQSVVRALVSRPFGKYADKHSWANMMAVCFGIGAAGFLVFAFAMPSNGLIMYTAYCILSGIYNAGVNGGMMNITFDYVSHEDRPYALGVKSAIGGLAGFLASLAGAKVVDIIETNGNMIFGYSIYAQQILSFAAFLLYVFIVFYIKNVIMKMKKVED